MTTVLITDEELNQIEARARMTGPMVKSTGDILKLVSDVRRLKMMVKNQEDGLTRQDMILRSLRADVDRLSDQRDNFRDLLMRASEIIGHNLIHMTELEKHFWIEVEKLFGRRA